MFKRMTLGILVTTVCVVAAMAGPAFAQTFVAPKGQDSVELVLSGGPSPTDPLSVDDDMYVYLNGNPILVNNDDFATELDPVSFTARDGDQLRIVAENDVDPCLSMSPLYLHSTSDGTSYQLSEGVEEDCTSASLGVFYDETFTITVESGPTSKKQCKKGGWKNFASLSFKNQGDCVSYVATGGKNPPSSE